MNQKATRDRIIEASDQLFYQRGYEHTSFTDISDAMGISRGNVTFHFRTKDDILDAVIDLRLERTRQMLERWETAGESCEDRIGSFINILITNQTKIMLYGCPVGTLCTELAKLEHAALLHANKVFTLFRDWLSRQFSQLGCQWEADTHALHVLAWSQGVATMAHAFRDERFIHGEVRRLHEWLRSLTSEMPCNTGARSAGQPKKAGRRSIRGAQAG